MWVIGGLLLSAYGGYNIWHSMHNEFGFLAKQLITGSGMLLLGLVITVLAYGHYATKDDADNDG